ncbi:hypothetical protein GQ55_9G456600 [Panicum hallii var. hallii]|uniref:DUF4057 domain-containing protein n=2 Tax=Panicum hallii TaxID=206008 RepID=A0A2T7CC06_9POAL|nr:uncharacterized protein LOC112878255 [Panicum hallii]PUZ40866.1 hypothetical protein GQ55_9G456600 [Panicum hallii var. hallii]
MERAAPVRSSHTSTAGLLAWPHPDGAGPLPARRPNQPTEEFRKVVFGGQGAEAVDGVNKMRTGSAPKLKEMTGSGIFKAGSAAAAPAASRDRQASQITFGQDGSIAPRKPNSVAEVARHRELSRTIQSEGDGKMKKQVSTAKSKELSGHDIFADHEDPKPNRSRRSDYSSSASLSQVSTFSFGEADADSAAKMAKKKGTSNKPADLNGKAIVEKDSAPAAKQPPNRAKLEEAAGSSSVSADGKAPATGEHAGRRTRQPPGGDSSISLA